MSKKSLMVGVVALSVMLPISLTTSALAARVKRGQSGQEVITCTLKVTKPAIPPKQPTGLAAGSCAAFGLVSDVGRETSRFTLIGNPPKAVQGASTFTGKRGMLTGQFKGSTAPVSFKPGPQPQVLEAVAIAKWSVTEATGAFAQFKGKTGVNPAYQNNATRTLKISILFG